MNVEVTRSTAIRRAEAQRRSWSVSGASERRACRPDDYPPHDPPLSQYRDCKGFARFVR